MIDNATLTFNGRVHTLEENKFSISSTPTPGIYDIYHSYDYTDGDERYHGRWYNMELRLEELQGFLNGTTFTYTMDFYEMEEEEGGEATITVNFKSAAVEKIRELLRGG
jgi:hypothetical protein